MLYRVRVSTTMALLLVVAMPVMAASPQKDCPAFSVELKGGYGKVNETVDGKDDNTDMVYGVAADYYLQCGVGVELGYDAFPKVKYTGGAIKGNEAIHLAAVGHMPGEVVGLRGKLGIAQTRADVPAGLSIDQGKHKEMALYASFGVDGAISSSLQWLIDVSAVTERKDVAAKYALSAGIRFNGG